MLDNEGPHVRRDGRIYLAEYSSQCKLGLSWLGYLKSYPVSYATQQNERLDSVPTMFCDLDP